MKKIPTLFEREFSNHRVVKVLDKVTTGFEWVLAGEGDATIKVDGSCTAFIDGRFYKRFDAKPGRRVPLDAVPCCEPDPVTGHWPHWVPVDWNDPSDRWFVDALTNTPCEMLIYEGTYEAIGPHFNGNPYGLVKDILYRHGCCKVDVERSYEGIRRYLETHSVEGLVFWKDGEPRCKIKRSDFGFKWPVPNAKLTEGE